MTLPAADLTALVLAAIAAGSLTPAQAEQLAAILSDYANFCDRFASRHPETPGDGQTRESPTGESDPAA